MLLSLPNQLYLYYEVLSGTLDNLQYKVYKSLKIF